METSKLPEVLFYHWLLNKWEWERKETTVIWVRTQWNNCSVNGNARFSCLFCGPLCTPRVGTVKPSINWNKKVYSCCSINNLYIFPSVYLSVYSSVYLSFYLFNHIFHLYLSWLINFFIQALVHIVLYMHPLSKICSMFKYIVDGSFYSS